MNKPAVTPFLVLINCCSAGFQVLLSDLQAEKKKQIIHVFITQYPRTESKQLYEKQNVETYSRKMVLSLKTPT